MTNTLTFSTAANTWTGVSPSYGIWGSYGSQHTAPRNHRPIFGDRSTRFLQNIHSVVRSLRDLAADHSALLMVGGVVACFATLATGLGVSIFL